MLVAPIVFGLCGTEEQRQRTGVRDELPSADRF
jgi:hypothetical protein